MVQDLPEMRASRTSRRPTSSFNHFQTQCSPSNDSPPAYAIAARHRLSSKRHAEVGREKLPDYSCTVNAESKVLLLVESLNPLNPSTSVSDGEWKEVYMTLRGTLLSFYRLRDGGPGKMIRSYTLQHAEVGMAPDAQHTVLVPQTRFAHVIPTATRRKAWQKDPNLFRPERQTLFRLRVETDQIVLAHSSEDRINEFVHAISAAIDISHVIDERSIPRQCTVPRRRRRQQARLDGDLSDPALLAEQERIMQRMYPTFAVQAAATRLELHRTPTDESPTGPAQTASRDEDDLDLATMREDFATPNAPAPVQDNSVSSRPAVSRQMTDSSVDSVLSTDMMYATSRANFNADGKWQPPHTRSAAHIQRYARRCMPVLLTEAVRASDIIVCNGKRLKINWRMELLEEWELSPPSYKAHNFTSTTGLERSTSQSSQTPSATNSTPQSSRSMMGAGTDQIERIESGLANLELTISKVTATPDKGSSRPQLGVKMPETRHQGAEVHGVVICF